MNLGIAGRKAIVCASSRGLGKACARALAEAVRRLAANRTESREMGRAGRRAIETNFNRETLAEKLVVLMEEMRGLYE